MGPDLPRVRGSMLQAPNSSPSAAISRASIAGPSLPTDSRPLSVLQTGAKLQIRLELPTPFLEAVDQMPGRREPLVLQSSDHDGREAGILEVRPQSVSELPHLSGTHGSRVELHLDPVPKLLDHPRHPGDLPTTFVSYSSSGLQGGPLESRKPPYASGSRRRHARYRAHRHRGDPPAAARHRREGQADPGGPHVSSGSAGRGDQVACVRRDHERCSVPRRLHRW